jgi:ferrous iron transport protein A
MGLGPGRRLRVSQREGGQMVVIVGETRLALGRGIAQKILVAAVG